MNNATTTPYISGDTREFASSVRKSFICLQKAYAKKYGFEGDDMTPFLNVIGRMINTEYCDLQMADKASGARGIAAAARSACYALNPFSVDMSAEYAEFERLTNFLEMSIASDKFYNA